jgi:hypothetical protein
MRCRNIFATVGIGAFSTRAWATLQRIPFTGESDIRPYPRRSVIALTDPTKAAVQPRRLPAVLFGNSYLIGKVRVARDPTTIPRDPVEARLNTTQRMGSDVKKRRRAFKPTHNLKADARTRSLLRTHWARPD